MEPLILFELVGRFSKGVSHLFQKIDHFLIEKMILPQLAMGIGIPLFFVPLMTISMTSVTPGETAAASGLINFLRTIAGAIATARSR